jgi:hypothetical protein
MANFVVLRGGKATSPGVLAMTMKQPMVVGLPNDGTTVEVRCNDFSNPQGVATAAPADTSGKQAQFQVTGKRLGRVMLEARQPTSDNDWFKWPLYASAQLLVSTDSPQEASKRSQDYQGIVIPPTHENCPPGMGPDVWADLLNFTKRYEGPTDFMYNDKSSPDQLITCGVGRMLRTDDEAVAIKKYFINAAGQEPSDPEVRADYAAAHSLVRTEGNLWDFATITALRLPWENVTKLLMTFMAVKVDAMRRSFKVVFANFANFPTDAQVACASISYGGWRYPTFAPLRDAVQAEDWALAAQVYRSPGWDHEKDEAHRGRFRRAAGR